MKLIEVHEAVYNRLDEVVEIPIWDYVPPDERPPFLVMRKTAFSFPENLATKTDEGYAVQQDILVVTEAREKHQAIEILTKIKNSLSEPLEIEGVMLYSQRFLDGEVYEQEDGLFLAETGIGLWVEDL